ncbi:ATP-binding protein [Desulfobacter latus]|uniref:AAA family ATPase n=1 Tax=Desulfobacter latus TaxID=2292 RepID=A0A850T0F9_9BACT|nr:AAA family ATPase [Desulfobacter latus]NWH05810.1 AAA family ATPase [Desulfobacter latus]
MQTYIPRFLAEKIRNKIKQMPAVSILGPRQCGKSTLAREILKSMTNTVYLDLERPSDVNKLRDPEAFFTLNRGKLICLDEIQRVSEIFPVMRSIIDAEGTNGQFLILGSASPVLLRQSSESLAGRISHIDLSPKGFDYFRF